jgi:hypothetical protein
LAILPAFCQNYPHRPVRARIYLDDQNRIHPVEQGERGLDGSSRTEPDEANPAENRKIGEVASSAQQTPTPRGPRVIDPDEGT